MKSRVQKNQDLHQSLATNTESDLESSSLSQFADRLNQIDNQFKKMDTSEHQNHEPQRARVIDETVETKTVPEPTSFDTFENTYLKDFLDEVKDYNVKKGFDSGTKQQPSTQFMSQDTSVRSVDSEAIQSVLEEINQFKDEPVNTYGYKTNDAVQEKPLFTQPSYASDVEATRIFSVDSLTQPEPTSVPVPVEQPQVEQPKVEELHAETVSISNAIKEMVAESAISDDVYSSFEIDEMIETEDEPEMELFESENVLDSDYSFDDNKFKQQLLEQTQTLQHKIIDQERNMDEMNETMVRTNRMLNVVLSLLLLAVVVVLILIFSYYI